MTVLLNIILSACVHLYIRLDETFIKRILWQTLQGVKYCHENQV